MKYEDVNISRHLLPNGEEAKKHDLNPEHLFDGSSSENRNDNRQKWDLSKEAVAFIRKELGSTVFLKKGDSGNFDKMMATKFNVAKSAITDIRLGRSYKADSHENTKVCGTLERPVIQFDMQGKVIAEYTSITKAAKTLNLDTSSISKACSGKRKSYKNFIWKYSENT